MDTMTPTSAPVSQPVAPVRVTTEPNDYLSKQLHSIVVLLSILVFLVAAFGGYGVYRHFETKSCIDKANSSSIGSLGVGDITYCMANN